MIELSYTSLPHEAVFQEPELYWSRQSCRSVWTVRNLDNLPTTRLARSHLIWSMHLHILKLKCSWFACGFRLLTRQGYFGAHRPSLRPASRRHLQTVSLFTGHASSTNLFIITAARQSWTKFFEPLHTYEDSQHILAQMSYLVMWRRFSGQQSLASYFALAVHAVSFASATVLAWPHYSQENIIEMSHGLITLYMTEVPIKKSHPTTALIVCSPLYWLNAIDGPDTTGMLWVFCWLLNPFHLELKKTALADNLQALTLNQCGPGRAPVFFAMLVESTWAESLLLHSGIVQGKAEISHINRKSDFSSLKVKFPDGRLNGAQIGASVAINGTCLTVSSFVFFQYMCLPVGSGPYHV